MARKAEGNVLRVYGGTLLAAMALAFLVRFLIIEAYHIPTPSMRPTLEPGETVFVAKWPFGLRLPFFQSRLTPGRPPERGEVVLASPPDDPKRELIKRVIGLEGDLVQIKDGKVLLNNNAIKIKSAKNETCGSESLSPEKIYKVCWEPPALEDFGPQKIPPGSVFLLSDLRTGTSLESTRGRAYGIFPTSTLKGKVLWIWLSIQPPNFGEKIGWFPKFRMERMFRRVQ